MHRQENNSPFVTPDNELERYKFAVMCSDGKTRIFRANGTDYITRCRGYVKVMHIQVRGEAVWTSEGWLFVASGKHSVLLPEWTTAPSEYWEE